MKKVHSYEVEDALAKLYFYTYISSIYKEYAGFKDAFLELLKLIELWISYYDEDSDLLRVSKAEVTYGKNLVDEVPFEAFSGYHYYDDVMNWYDIVVYYASVPIGIEYDEDKIEIKDGRK